MTDSQRPLKVFISYASQDRTLVNELSHRLVDEGWIDPWVDEKKLLPGQDWRTKIEEAVETSDAVIICLSNNSVTKEGFVQKELRYAREISFEKPDDTIFLIPLRLDECEVPRGLRFFQWVDFFEKNKDKSYEALVESLKLRYEQKLKFEKAELVREEKERLERETAEKAEREQAERKALERVAREKLEREVWEKATRENLEREAAEKLAQEKAKRDEIERIKREKAERQAARKAEIASFFSKMLPFTKVIFLIGSVVVLFGIGLWAVPKFLPSTPMIESTATMKQQAEPSTILASPTIAIVSSPTLSLTSTPSVTNTPEVVDEQLFNIEHLETITIENLPKLTQLALITYDGNFLGVSPSGKTIVTDAGLVYSLEAQQIICDISQIKEEQHGGEYALSDNYVVVSDGLAIQAWDLQKCTSETMSIPSLGSVTDVAIAPDDINLLVQGTTTLNSEWRHVLWDWHLDRNELVKRSDLGGVGSAISDMIVARDGVTFVGSTGGGFAQIYTVSDFTLRSKFAASNLWANIISYRPDKDILITSDEYPTTNTNIRIWNISNGKIIYKIPDVTKISSGVLGLSSDGKMYVASNEKKLSFWSIEADVEAYALELDKLIFGSVFSNNQKILLVLLDGNRIAVYGVNPE